MGSLSFYLASFTCNHLISPPHFNFLVSKFMPKSSQYFFFIFILVHGKGSQKIKEQVFLD